MSESLLSAPVDETATETATPAQAEAPETQSVESQDWRPETLRGEKALEKYKSQEDALKALVNAQKLIGKKAEGIVPPGADAKPEEVEAFRAKLREIQGVPDAPDKYELPTLDGLPDGLTVPEEATAWFKNIAHKHGLSPAQMQGVYADFLADIEAPNFLARSQGTQQAITEGLTGLRKEFAGKTKEVLQNANAVVEHLGLTESDIGSAANNPKFIKAMANLAPMFGEGGLKGSGKAEKAMTPEEARAKGREMMRDPRYSDRGRRDPGYVREVESFFDVHFPGERETALRK